MTDAEIEALIAGARKWHEHDSPLIPYFTPASCAIEVVYEDGVTQKWTYTRGYGTSMSDPTWANVIAWRYL